MDRPRRDLEDGNEANDPLEPEVITFAREQVQAAMGFRHAFFDYSTCAIYLSTDRMGRPANCHTLEGLPDGVVARAWITGRVASVKATLVAGFERNGMFYTARSAARAAAEWFVRD